MSRADGQRTDPAGTPSPRRPRLRWPRGRELETCLVSGTALAVGLLGLFDVTKPGVVAAATLAVLSLIVFDMLLDRQRLRRIESSLGGLTDSVRSDRRPASIDRFLMESVPWPEIGLTRATDIRLIGVTLNRTIRSHLEELKRQLDAGAVVKIAIIDPSGDPTVEAARRNGLGADARLFEHRVQPTLDLLAYLGGDPASPGRLEVRLLPFVPAFGIGLVDPMTAQGRLWVDIYSHRPDGREAVILLEAGRSPRWYQHFVQEFERIWASGRPFLPERSQAAITEGERCRAGAEPPGGAPGQPAAGDPACLTTLA